MYTVYPEKILLYLHINNVIEFNIQNYHTIKETQSENEIKTFGFILKFQFWRTWLAKFLDRKKLTKIDVVT